MSKLFVIPTPIGNLEDITLRGLRKLQEVNLILAEDTRTSRKLLKHYKITTPCESFHMFNEHKKLRSIIDRMQAGTSIGLISDAGTPGISDPGYLLIRAALAHQIPVECLPGATALIPALVQSGLPSDRFVFEGFLPPKKGRKKRLDFLAQEKRTIVLYESPHKLLKTLQQLNTHFGPERNIVVLRELTKLHETTYSTTLSAALEYFEKTPPKGELVLCLAGLNN
ncbi:MAG: 16S rRNA (cytidine(1402)-2'-O)-methyltransferase [Flavobacteriaceae bacterium]